MSQELDERLSVLTACRTAIAEKERLFAAISSSETSAGLNSAVQQEFQFTFSQAEAALNLQVRHFSIRYLERLSEQIAALEASAS